MIRTPRWMRVAAWSSALVSMAIAAAVAAPWLRPTLVSAVDGPDQATVEQLRHARDLSAAFKQAAKAVGPSVVHVTSVVRGNSNDDRRFGNRPWRTPFDIPDQIGTGTGVIVRPDGYIVTNNHVVSGADQIEARLQDGRELVATLVGVDPDTDLAILKIDSIDLVPARFGDSDVLDVGEWVLAVGNPFGLDQTVTAGIVSAKGRVGMGLATYENFIQTDAAINPGNSGGPLVNLMGEVVGINTAISTRNGGSMGIGFAIPSSMVRRVVDDLLESGFVDRGWLGVQPRGLTPRIAEAQNFHGSVGTVVATVVPDAPADLAGIQPGDIILSIGGRATPDPTQLRQIVADFDPQSTVNVVLFRGGEQKEVPVRLGQRPGAQTAAVSAKADGSLDLGLTVIPMSRQLARRLGASGRGVAVEEVVPDGPAALSGIRPGDAVLRMGDQEIQSPDDFGRAVRQQDPEAPVRLYVERDGVGQWIVLKTK